MGDVHRRSGCCWEGSSLLATGPDGSLPGTNEVSFSTSRSGSTKSPRRDIRFYNLNSDKVLFYLNTEKTSCRSCGLKASCESSWPPRGRESLLRNGSAWKRRGSASRRISRANRIWPRRSSPGRNPSEAEGRYGCMALRETGAQARHTRPQSPRPPMRSEFSAVFASVHRRAGKSPPSATSCVPAGSRPAPRPRNSSASSPNMCDAVTPWHCLRERPECTLR